MIQKCIVYCSTILVFFVCFFIEYLNGIYNNEINKQNRFNNGNSLKTKQVLNQMNDIKDVMINNIDMILQRGEKLDLIIDKTSDLAETATV